MYEQVKKNDTLQISYENICVLFQFMLVVTKKYLLNSCFIIGANQ